MVLSNIKYNKLNQNNVVSKDVYLIMSHWIGFTDIFIPLNHPGQGHGTQAEELDSGVL